MNEMLSRSFLDWVVNHRRVPLAPHQDEVKLPQLNLPV